MINKLFKLVPDFISPWHLERILEPMVMDEENQVRDYCEYALSDSPFLASSLYHATGISLAIQGSKNVIDLGCGPATMLSLVAALNPQIQFTGVDLSESMLDQAQKILSQKNIKNVNLIKGDITTLSNIKDHSFDGAMSTVALHHLPSNDHLEQTFKSLRRILKEPYNIYLTDFLLLKTERMIHFLVDLNKNQTELFRNDYINSLKAAYPKAVVSDLAQRYLPATQLYKTSLLPFMYILKTENRNGSIDHNEIFKIYEQLSEPHKLLFRDLYRLFKWSGVKNNLANLLVA